MVQIQRLRTHRRSLRPLLCFLSMLLVGVFLTYIYKISHSKHTKDEQSSINEEEAKSKFRLGSSSSSQKIDVENVQKAIPCEYKKMSDLKDYEIHPSVSESLDGNQRRHAYEPPIDGLVTLVCCETTAGSFSVAVHDTWAPLGAANFLKMVETKYFSSRIALMRCVHNFLCQFGIAGDPKLNKDFKSFPDDKNWLKEGPDFRTNPETGAKRFARGYFAYAGSGKNSRGNQLIVALKDNKFLGGGSPWEVPFGELVGMESYETLAKISTVYGEKGPSQGLLYREGSSSKVAEQFPHLDYITSCTVVDSIDFKSV